MKPTLSFLFSKVSGSKSLQHSSKGPFKTPGAFYGASPDLSHYLCNEDIQTGSNEKKDSEHLLFIKLERLQTLGWQKLEIWWHAVSKERSHLQAL